MGKKSTLKGPALAEAPSKQSAVVILEAAVLGWLARKHYKKALHNAELRMKVVKEIIETEKSYLQSVECIVLDYLESIRNSFPPLLPPESITIIFGKIEDIFLINKELYEQLTIDDRVAKRIGDIFLKTAPYLKLYSEYCKNYPLAIAKLKKHLEDERFGFFIKKIRGDGSILDLPSLLIMPVQRIPRYKLLLIELLKRTEAIEPDYADLKVALGKVSEVADHINNVIKERQNLEKLLSIQKKLTGAVPPIVIPRRVFLREGSLMKVCRKVSKKRWVILFNDAFIYGSTVDTVGKYKFHRLQNLIGGKVKDVPDKPKHKNAFQIICKEKSFTVFASSPEEKRSWYNSFDSAFNNINQNNEPSPILPRFSKHYSYHNVLATANNNVSQRQLTATEESDSAPVWVPDSDAERCMICSIKFTAFKRRHHCRKCGKVVCAKCSDYSYKLDNLNKTARVCAYCFKELTQTAPHSVSKLPSSESYENLVEFFGHLMDSSSPKQDKSGVMTMVVKRINASEKGMAMAKGKMLVPQTRKAQRRVLYNITSTVVNGGERDEQNGNGTSSADHHSTDSSFTDALNSLPPLPTLPAQPRPRLATLTSPATLASPAILASPATLTPPNGVQHNHSPNLPRPFTIINTTNTPPHAVSLDDTTTATTKGDRRSSMESTDHSTFADALEDVSSVPSIDEHNSSPKLHPVVVGN